MRNRVGDAGGGWSAQTEGWLQRMLSIRAEHPFGKRICCIGQATTCDFEAAPFRALFAGPSHRVKQMSYAQLLLTKLKKAGRHPASRTPAPTAVTV